MTDRLSTKEQAREYHLEVYRKLIDILKTNKNANFTVSLRGVIAEHDISDQLQFDKEQGKLVTGGPRLAYLDNNVIQDSDGSTPPLFKKFPYYATGTDTFVLGFKEYAMGDKNAKFVTERRQQPFFAGFKAARAESNYTKEQMATLRTIIELRDSNPEVFIQMMEAICYEYIPDYYKELKQMEERYKPKP